MIGALPLGKSSETATPPALLIAGDDRSHFAAVFTTLGSQKPPTPGSGSDPDIDANQPVAEGAAASSPASATIEDETLSEVDRESPQEPHPGWPDAMPPPQVAPPAAIQGDSSVGLATGAISGAVAGSPAHSGAPITWREGAPPVPAGNDSGADAGITASAALVQGRLSLKPDAHTPATAGRRALLPTAFAPTDTATMQQPARHLAMLAPIAPPSLAQKIAAPATKPGTEFPPSGIPADSQPFRGTVAVGTVTTGMVPHRMSGLSFGDERPEAMPLTAPPFGEEVAERRTATQVLHPISPQAHPANIPLQKAVMQQPSIPAASPRSAQEPPPGVSGTMHITPVVSGDDFARAAGSADLMGATAPMRTGIAHAEPRGTMSSASSILDGGPLTRGAETAMHIARQLAPAIATTGDSGFEVILSPAELGTVRLKLLTTETGSQLIVQSDRPETMDLMRRHIGILEQDLRALGHDSLSVRFAGGGGTAGFGHPNTGSQAQPPPPAQEPAADGTAATAPPVSPPTPPMLRADDHLDLRL